jgi:ceramide glucosyltransferase
MRRIRGRAVIEDLGLVGAAALGLLFNAIQLGSTWRHRRARRPVRRETPGISILKPLCGIDDGLERNLEAFAILPYPRYELLLGVRAPDDPAWPVARAAQARWPGRVRAILQQGEPGLNPKVNQLITLARAARFDVLVVSDSNVRPDGDYLDEIAAWLDDQEVGLVTHPVAGEGERTMGPLLENLHLCADVGAGMIVTQRLMGLDFVVGKSMALRRSDLDALGGFEAVKDVLAEDRVMGRMVRSSLKKRVVVGHCPVFNVSRDRRVGEFLDRYRRWSVILRHAVGPVSYGVQVLIYPVAVALAAACTPGAVTLGALGVITLVKVLIDGAAMHVLRGDHPSVRLVAAVPMKDVLLGLAWLHGLTHRTVVWRGHRLRVLPGTRLAAVEAGLGLRPPERGRRG